MDHIQTADSRFDPQFGRWLVRRISHARGYWSEWLAAASLQLRGYRILGRRYRARCGEIDLIARRGSTIAFVEVKFRQTIRDCESSITSRQSARLRRAAAVWVASRPRYQHFEQRFDAVYVLPNGWPRHLMGSA